MLIRSVKIYHSCLLLDSMLQGKTFVLLHAKVQQQNKKITFYSVLDIYLSYYISVSSTSVLIQINWLRVGYNKSHIFITTILNWFMVQVKKELIFPDFLLSSSNCFIKSIFVCVCIKPNQNHFATLLSIIKENYYSKSRRFSCNKAIPSFKKKHFYKVFNSWLKVSMLWTA